MKKEILSVGVDIGTTTTQVIFSRITLENASGSLSIPDIKVTEKEVVYRSHIHFTPLISRERIDGAALKEVIREEYIRSGIRPDDVFSGAIIITGETARKENAQEISRSLAGYAGDFVVASAGPELEAILAGWGSGAGQMSRKIPGKVINFDIGGGTTNAAVFENGKVVDAFALDIGGRLIMLEKNGSINYISDRLWPVLKQLDLALNVGDRVGFEVIHRIAHRLAEMFLELLGERELSQDTRQLFIGHMAKGIKADVVMFSGGVAEFIYSQRPVDSLSETARFHDIGPLLGRCIRDILRESSIKVACSREKIRATVIGAGSYSMKISGSTVVYADKILPMRDIPVVKITGGEDGDTHSYDVSLLGSTIREKIRYFGNETVAIAFSGPKNPGFQAIRQMAKEIAANMADSPEPLVVIVEHDFAKALGMMIKKQLPFSKPVICLDGIRVSEGEYIDIGRPLAGVIPVVVKTLIFDT